MVVLIVRCIVYTNIYITFFDHKELKVDRIVTSFFIWISGGDSFGYPIVVEGRRLPVDEKLVNRRVRVWWDGNCDWFAADVIDFDRVKKLHKLQVRAEHL